MLPAPHYGLDIETDTTIDGLDPSFAAVVAVGVSTPTGDRVLLGPEARVLSQLDELLAALDPGVIVTWNGSSFDLPFLAARAALHGIRLSLELFPQTSPTRPARAAGVNGAEGTDGSEGTPMPWHLASWGAHRHLDGYRLYRADVGRTLGLSCGLKAVARLVGIEPVQVDRERIHELSEDELARYVASDARLACELVARRLPAAAAFVDRCPTGVRAPSGAGSAVTAR